MTLFKVIQGQGQVKFQLTNVVKINPDVTGVWDKHEEQDQPRSFKVKVRSNFNLLRLGSNLVKINPDVTGV